MKRTDRYLEPVTRLRDELVATDTFSDVVERFDQTFATDPGFHRACRTTESPLLDGVLEQLAHRVFGPRARWQWLSPLSRYAPAGFVHAVALVEGQYALVLYFEDREIGLVTLSGATNQFFRFSAVALPPGALPGGSLGHA